MNVEEQQTAEQGNQPGTRSLLIKQDQLPLHCPLPEMSLWNSHPRVYLPIQETGSAVCPYCGTEYRLDGD